MLACLALVLAGPCVSEADANGGTARLDRAPAGPYLVSAWTRPDPPRVGRIDVTVAIMRPPAGEPVLDAEVHASAALEGVDRGPVRARLERGGGGNLLLYHGDLEAAAPGRWRVTVTVEAPQSRGQAAFELEVRPRQALPGPLAVVMGLVLLGAVGWLWARGRRQKPRA